MAATATRKIAYNTVVQVVGKVVITLIAGISVIVLTRYLGAEDYGKFNLALAYLSLFGIFADVGLFTIVVREISKTPERTEELIGNVLTLRLVLSVAVILAAFGVSQFLPYAPDVRIAILIAGVAIFFGLLNSSLITVFQARLRMDYAVIADTVGRSAAFAAVLVVAGLNLGFYAIVATAAVGSFITLLVTYYFARKLVRIRLLTDLAVSKEMLLASLPLGAALALNQIYFKADLFLLSLFRSYQDVGLYALVVKILEILLAFVGFFYNSIFPLLSKYIADKDDRVRTTLQTSFDFLAMTAVPVAVGGWFVAPQLISLAGGAEFLAATQPLQALLIAAAFAFVSGLFGFALVAKSRVKALLWLNVVALIVNVGLNVIFIPQYGIMAAAVITALSELGVLLGAYYLTRRYFGFFPHFQLLPKVFVAATVMGGAMFVTGFLPLFALAPFGALVYAGTLYLIGGIDKATLSKLRIGG